MTTWPYCNIEKRNLPTQLEHTCTVKQIADTTPTGELWRFETECCGRTPVRGKRGLRCSKCRERVYERELVDKKHQ